MPSVESSDTDREPCSRAKGSVLYQTDQKCIFSFCRPLVVAGVMTDKSVLRLKVTQGSLAGPHAAHSRVSPVLLLHTPATDTVDLWTVAMVIIRFKILTPPKIRFLNDQQKKDQDAY